MRKKEKIFFGLMIATSVFGCIAYGQPLLPTEEGNSETINYWQDNQQDQPGRGYQQNKSDGEIVVPYRPEESNSPEAQELKKQQQQQQQQKQEEKKCNGIKLNTNFPIIGNCIGDDAGEDATKAFPSMIGAFTKIVMALILVGCFIIIIYAGILWAADKPKEARDWLKRVAITILLLGFSGAILKLINPNFFTS